MLGQDQDQAMRSVDEDGFEEAPDYLVQRAAVVAAALAKEAACLAEQQLRAVGLVGWQRQGGLADLDLGGHSRQRLGLDFAGSLERDASRSDNPVELEVGRLNKLVVAPHSHSCVGNLFPASVHRDGAQRLRQQPQEQWPVVSDSALLRPEEEGEKRLPDGQPENSMKMQADEPLRAPGRQLVGHAAESLAALSVSTASVVVVEPAEEES